jgi:hypothetical protein
VFKLSLGAAPLETDMWIQAPPSYTSLKYLI